MRYTLNIEPEAFEFDPELAFEVAPVGVRWVQQALNLLRGSGLAVDGVTGPQTRRVIVDFQRSRGLVADGIVGPATAEALRQALLAMPSGEPPCGAVGRPAEELVGFAFDDDQLQPAHLLQIGKIAQCVASRGGSEMVRSLRIVGHTDPVGDDAYNLRLGLRRAEAVARALREALEYRRR